MNGGDDVRLTVRESVHGPLVSDVLDLVGVGTAPVPEDAPGRRFEVALGWTALQPGRTMDAVLAMNVAKDAADIQAAAALFDVPSQNIVFATTDGHIGYQAPGRIPVRATSPAGRSRRTAPGRGRGGTAGTSGRGSSTRPPCRARWTPSRGSSSPPTRPSPRPVSARS